MRTKTCNCGERMYKHTSDVVDNKAIEWKCMKCGATAPLRKPGPPPDTPLRLGAERRAWLEAHGGASAWIKQAIDTAIEEEKAEPEIPFW